MNTEEATPEHMFRVRRRIMVDDKVYDRGDLVTGSELGKQLAMLVSSRLVIRIHEVNAEAVVVPDGFFARLRQRFFPNR